MSRISFHYSSTRSGHSLKTKKFPKYGPTPGLNPTFILSSPNDVRLKIVGGGIEYRLGRPHSNPIPALSVFRKGFRRGSPTPSSIIRSIPLRPLVIRRIDLTAIKIHLFSTTGKEQNKIDRQPLTVVGLSIKTNLNSGRENRKEKCYKLTSSAFPPTNSASKNMEM